MISVRQALQIVSRETHSLGTERIDLADAIGRVLGEDIVADTDMPPFDRSQMDGYAVKASDTTDVPVELNIVGESAAGSGWKGELKKGEAVRIMTGAPVPAGADAVQKLELAREKGDLVELSEPTTKGRYIVHRGTEIRKGKVVMRSGETLEPTSIAIPAAFGYAKVTVAKRPRVAILSTGSEIVEINRKPKPDQIRNSNSLMLASLCRAIGTEPILLPITGDSISDLRSRISEAVKTADILITTGGVSVGKYDLTKTALTDLGAEVFFERLRLKPGKPTVFARLKKTLVFGLPGNPVSAAVTFYLFVRKAILQMQSATVTDLKPATAVTINAVKAPKERDAYIPASISTDSNGSLFVKPLNWHGSSDFIGFSQAEALIIVPKGETFEQGTCVRILFLR